MNIAVFASSGGSNFAAIVQAIRCGELKANIQCLVTDRSSAGAGLIAKESQIPVHCLDPKGFSSRAIWDQKMVEILGKYSIDLVILAGFLRKLEQGVLEAFGGKIINTHPSLLPKYGGKGMYGRNVHRAVLDSGESTTGITIHYVTQNYDEGPIISQKKVEVLSDDDVESLEARVKQAENQFLVETLKCLYESICTDPV